ncbi:MAG TPA: hypothetical protein VMN81_10655 [Vicinamibacterales bacterium]|nr:hypothetical protein [Vicinamibacterales bacterium]
MTDPFTGTWTLNPTASQFDPNHRPGKGTMRLELTPEGAYVLNAEGMNAKGEMITERPQTFVPDGRPYPLPDFPGLSSVASQPDGRTLRVEARREDGSLAGEGTYVVSADGRSLSATTAGFDTQLRRFETMTAWDKIA